MTASDRQVLTGWGRTAPTVADVVRPATADDAAAALEHAPPRGIIARGLGRSYGDPAQNAGGQVIDTTGVSGIHHLDIDEGRVTADAGTSLEDLMRWLVPLGWFVPVTPGTRQVTVGGAIASDIHGKNHHRAGSWCSHVEAMTIVTPAGGKQRITPSQDPDLFWATAGGMGLTGIVLDATIRLKPIETSRLLVDTDRTKDLESTFELMATTDHLYDYTVAWIDLETTGVSMGRSVVTRGSFATLDALREIAPRKAERPLDFHARALASTPPVVPPKLLNHFTLRAFNEAWYRKAPKHRVQEPQTIGKFFHPLDMLRDWNRLYGRLGMLQWQPVVPFEALDTMRSIIGQLCAATCPSFVTVLKRMGPGNPGPLSFPKAGWTLNIDVPISSLHGLGSLLDDLDEQVVEAGGRVYLAKDSRLRPELLPLMYPRLDEWKRVRAEVDPDRVLQSDLGRRLGLV